MYRVQDVHHAISDYFWPNTAQERPRGPQDGPRSPQDDPRGPKKGQAAWDILEFQAGGQNPRHVKFPELQEVVVNVYEEQLDRILLGKAMWIATSATFAADDSKVQTQAWG